MPCDNPFSGTTRTIIFAAVIVLLVGCVNLGPAAIRAGRTEYNIALGATRDEQLLLNIVRLRYRDPAFFLKTTALTTQFRFSPELEASASLVSGADLYTLRGSYLYEEKPTVSYVPLSGQEFVGQILTPVSFATIQLLSNAGWSIERILRLCVDELNGVPNAPRAAGPTPTDSPEFEQFRRVANLFRALQLNKMIAVGHRQEDGESIPTLQFSREALDSSEYKELVDLLGLNPGQTTYKWVKGVGGGRGDVIAMETRSYSAILFFMSQSVEVPSRDEDDGRVTVTRDESGEPFDWSMVTGGMMRIQSSESRPSNATVAVRYRGSWFYIDDSDLDSKSTFVLLSQLSALQSADVRGAAPLLTLPVG